MNKDEISARANAQNTSGDALYGVPRVCCLCLLLCLGCVCLRSQSMKIIDAALQLSKGIDFLARRVKRKNTRSEKFLPCFAQPQYERETLFSGLKLAHARAADHALQHLARSQRIQSRRILCRASSAHAQSQRELIRRKISQCMKSSSSAPF